jgi:hypothetical protein
VSSKSNGPKTGRRVGLDFSWPITSQDAGGNKTIVGRMTGTASVLIPQNQPIANIEEQAHQFCNLMAAELIKDSVSDGYAPR